MISLFISAQDIKYITFGCVKDQTVTHEKTYGVSPEKYLEALNLFFHEYKIASDDFQRILLVRGPGSFTASRMSAVIANTLAFTKEIPLAGVENPDRLSLEILLAHFETGSANQFAFPAYDRPPNIT